jgi:lipoprotein-releasing system permease protein
MPYELFVALRYLVARRRQAFISLISFVSALGVAVGVTALVIALALMTGLQDEMRDRMLGAMAHVYVSKVGENGVADPEREIARLCQVPRVTGAAPIVLGNALMRTGRGDAFVTIKGIDPAREASVTDIAKRMKKGSLDALTAGGSEGLDRVVLGESLSSRLGVFEGDTVRLLTPEATLTPMGPVVRPRTLQVVGIFSLGFDEFDSGYALVSLDTAKRVLGKTQPDFIELRVDDIYAAPEVSRAVTRQLGAGYATQDWADMNASLFSALWLEKMAISITIGLIVMVAALNIIASLVLMVMEKSRDIAILKTMGSTPRSITIIFMLQGLLIGAIGTLVGAVLGRTIVHFLDRYKVISIPTEVYQISYVPFKLQTGDFVVVILAALAICFVATIYPSRQAARLDPAEALRYS